MGCASVGAGIGDQGLKVEVKRAMSVNGRMRPLDIRRDLDGLGELVEVSFAGDLARRGGDFRQELRLIKRVIPLVIVLGRISDSFRHLVDGFVWEDGGRIVASVLVQKSGNDKTRWYISDIATHPDYRRRGLARKLTSRAMEHARAYGAQVCTLSVRADNAPAYNLYRSLGFVHYDSTTHLKLEGLPGVQVRLTDGYSLRPLKQSEWQVRYDLALRDTPPEVQAFLPISEAQYRVSALEQLFMPLSARLQRIDDHRWAAERDGQWVGYVGLSARRVANTNHNLRLTLDPGHRATLAEPLLALALETLQKYPRQNTLTWARTGHADLLALLKRYGFVEIEIMHQLGAKLNHASG
jgi:ribosomal protein S18 acetylase RimI-like enzyme